MFEFYRKNKIIIKKNKNEFRRLKFIHNNYTILFIGYFLFLEQFIYYLFLANNNLILEKIHLTTSFIALFYAFIATYFKLNKNYEYSKVKSFYEISFGIVGFIVAMFRVILITKDSFYLPVIYIAVIYGFSFIFYFRPYKSFLIYSLSSISIIISLLVYTNYDITPRVIGNILSNNIIAWLASVISYFKYSKNFINKKIINQKNKKLKIQTREIKKINEKLKEINSKDSLIDIYNRRKLDEILSNKIEKFRSNGEKFSIIILDIDSFKDIND
ncbi:MAG: GGDEF domain-containing protein, partial [Bacillota bacterium]